MKKNKQPDIIISVNPDFFNEKDMQEFKGMTNELRRNLKKINSPLTVALKKAKK